MITKARVAIAFVVAAVVFQAWAFTMVPEAEIFFGEPPMPDVRATGYSPEEVRNLLLEIGEQGREQYLVAQRKIDLAIPALGMGMFFFGLWALADGLVVGKRRWPSRQALALGCVGLIPGLFDYAENLLVASIMQRGLGAFEPRLVEMASACTQIKFAFVALCLILVVVLGVLRWRQRRQPVV
jgi:hypothetical protein